MDNNKKTSTYMAYAPHVLNLLEKACFLRGPLE